MDIGTYLAVAAIIISTVTIAISGTGIIRARRARRRYRQQHEAACRSVPSFLYVERFEGGSVVTGPDGIPWTYYRDDYPEH